MSIRTIAAATTLAIGSLAVSAGSVQAAPQVEDHDCPDFRSEAAAQRYFDIDPSDPHRLDRDNDGKACEAGGGSQDSTESDTDARETDNDHDEQGEHSVSPQPQEDDDSGTETQQPEGGVDAGGGGLADDDDASVALPASIAAGTALAAGGVFVLRRRAGRNDDN